MSNDSTSDSVRLVPQLSAFVRLVAKETEKMVSYFFKGEQCDEVGPYLDKPVTEKFGTQGSGNALRYGMSSMQGWRAQMEDAHTIVPALPKGLQAWSFYAVFDGHAGSKVAHYCSENLLGYITGNEDFGGDRGRTMDHVKNGIRTGFLEIDSRMHSLSRFYGWDRSGSTAVAVMVSPHHLYFVNCGDSRAVLSRNSSVCFYTEDHKPFKPREKERIQNAGGTVTWQRVNGSLAVSRALGDFDFKAVEWRGQTEQLVSPEPEVYEMLRSDSDEFIILACDGIWDTITNEDLCKFVRSRLQLTPDLEDICKQVIDVCLYKGSQDNMSIILLCFPNAPGVSQEAIQREVELNAYIEEKVTESFRQEEEEEQGSASLFRVMHDLAQQNLPNLPPGAGLCSK
eukprot:gi/632988566/ref/XP_007883183.1/ PREDICTED: protein phosphatase 1A-like [Callorhinchus milii]